MNPLSDPSQRRFLALVAGLAAAALNKRLGLEIAPDTLMEMLVLVGGYVVAGNAKAIAEANAAGKAAAAGITTPEQAAAELGKTP
jgi:hypothetical protein